jgi:hypothetical protein
MELTHVEISVEAGTVEGLECLLVDVLGWSALTQLVDHPVLGPSTEHVFTMTGGERFVVREVTGSALRAGTEDHLGFRMDSAELDRLFEACRRLRDRHPDLELSYVVDDKPFEADLGAVIFRTFFVRFRLPVWFQFEAWDPKGSVSRSSMT